MLRQARIPVCFHPRAALVLAALCTAMEACRSEAADPSTREVEPPSPAAAPVGAPVDARHQGSPPPEAPSAVIPSPAPDPATPPTPVAPTPPSLPDLVADLAVVYGSRVGCESAQTSVAASWASADDLDESCLLRRGDVLHVVGPAGLHPWTVDEPRRSGRTVSPPPGVVASSVQLATKQHAPSSKARLVERWLSPRVRDAERLAAWVLGQRGRRHLPVGEIRGAFGDGIDRIAIFRPAKLRRSAEEEAEDPDLAGEVAVLVEGTTPRATLPFDRALEHAGETWTEGVTGLQVAGVVDLDGNGTEEVLWVGEPAAPELVTSAWISYIVDGEPQVHELWACTYCGCEVLLPQSRCRSTVKDPGPRHRSR